MSPHEEYVKQREAATQKEKEINQALQTVFLGIAQGVSNLLSGQAIVIESDVPFAQASSIRISLEPKPVVAEPDSLHEQGHVETEVTEHGN